MYVTKSSVSATVPPSIWMPCALSDSDTLCQAVPLHGCAPFGFSYPTPASPLSGIPPLLAQADSPCWISPPHASPLLPLTPHMDALFSFLGLWLPIPHARLTDPPFQCTPGFAPFNGFRTKLFRKGTKGKEWKEIGNKQNGRPGEISQ